MKNKCFAAFAFGFCLAVLADTITLNTPDDGATLSMLKPEQQLYCLLDSQAGRQVLASLEQREFLSSSVRSFPKGIKLGWTFIGEATPVRYEVVLADNEDFTNARVLPTREEHLTLYNLLLGKKYYWKVDAIRQDGRRLESDSSCFIVDARDPRFLYVPDVDNVRDIGGFTGLEGRVMPHGLIYRSSGLNFNSSDGGKTPGAPRVNAEGVLRMREELHLRTELDLRGNGETAGMTVSPIGEDINYIQIPVGAYEYIFSPNGAKPFADCFRVFLNPANYPIDYHCIGGADRTGSLSFLLEALLGADSEHLYRDYVLTSFYATRDYNACDTFFQGLGGYGTPEESLVTKAERYFFACGITPDEIEAFRAYILGPGLPETPGCAFQRHLDELCAPYTQTTEAIKIRPYFPYSETMKMGGKEISFNAPIWNYTPVQKILSDGQGTTIVQLLNHDPEPRFFQLRPDGLDAENYTVVDLLSKTAYAQPDGTPSWTKAQLRSFRFTLPPGITHLLVFAPGSEIPAGYTIKTLETPTVPAPDYLEVPSGTAPEIDGLLDDAIWSIRDPFQCARINGMVDEKHAPLVHLRTDPEHDTLFIAATIPDSTLNGSDHGDERDQQLWLEDEIEVFVGGYGRGHYFHFVFNRFGNIYDANGSQKGWDAKEYQVATRQYDDHWTVEIALPIRLFDYVSPLRINVCFTDYPSTRRFALNPTGDSFHNRSAFQTIFLK